MVLLAGPLALDRLLEFVDLVERITRKPLLSPERLLRDRTNIPQPVIAPIAVFTTPKVSRFEPPHSDINIEAHFQRETEMMRSSFTSTLAALDRKTSCLKKRSVLNSSTSSSIPPQSPALHRPGLKATCELVTCSLDDSAFFRRRKAAPLLLRTSYPNLPITAPPTPLSIFLKKLSSTSFYSLYASLQAPSATTPHSAITTFVEHLVSSDPYFKFSRLLFSSILHLADEQLGCEVLTIFLSHYPPSSPSSGRNLSSCLLLSLRADKIELASTLLKRVSGTYLGPSIDFLVSTTIKRHGKVKLRLLGSMMKKYAGANKD